jgi:hypothetical protein
MLSNISISSERQSIFETTVHDSVLFSVFMLVQTSLLLGVFTFTSAVEYGYIVQPDITTSFTAIVLFTLCFIAFYTVSRCLYLYVGVIFTENAEYKLMLTNFQALYCTWGLTLYVPVLWVIFIGRFYNVALILLIISYITFRILLISRFFNIFFNENTRFLFFLLYLCTSEMALLVFMFEGMTILYNYIWH